MARALARGWGDPCCARPYEERPQPRGGGRRDRAREQRRGRGRSTWSCCATSRAAARGRRRTRRLRRSCRFDLAATPLADLQAAYPPGPSTGSFPPCPSRCARERRAGGGTEQEPVIDAQVSELFASLGTLVVLDDSLVDVAMGLMSCAPAYVALVAEARSTRRAQGIPRRRAELVVQTLAGTAELLRRRGNDTMAVRRRSHHREG